MQEYLLYTCTFLICFIMTTFMVPRLLLLSLRKRLFDKINIRKAHTCSASRFGGVAFLPSIYFSIMLVMGFCALVDPNILSNIFSPRYIFISCACMLIYSVGIVDDVLGVRYRTKLIYQLCTATLICLAGVYITDLHGIFGINQVSLWIGVPMSILLIIGITNAINFIDGIDGLAAGISIVALITFGISFVMVRDIAFALFSFSTLAALMAFEYYNVFGFKNKTSKIFMGDSGSLLIGTILSVLTIKLCSYKGGGDEHAAINILIAYSLLIIPCFDVIRVMFERKRRGLSMFLPDKNHIHHKLMALGFSQRKTLLMILLLDVLFLCVNIICYQWVNIYAIFIADIIIWCAMHFYVSQKIKHSLKILE